MVGQRRKQKPNGTNYKLIWVSRIRILVAKNAILEKQKKTFAPV